jgi:hypothetical protein
MLLPVESSICEVMSQTQWPVYRRAFMRLRQERSCTMPSSSPAGPGPLPLCPLALAVGFAFATLLAPVAAHSQPFGVPGEFLTANPTESYVEIPSSPSLNPANQITIELWSASSQLPNCTSLLGKGYTTSFWIGNCGGTLRSYLAGKGSQHDGGTILDGSTHIAVTYDGVARKHYIDGELVGVFPQSGPLPANSHPLRLGSDFDFLNHSSSSIWEVRLWSVARTQAQIRQFINQEIDSAMPGLVAVWHLRGNANDPIGGHNGGAPQGNAKFDTIATGSSCFGYPNEHPPLTACFLARRFGADVSWELFSAPAADGHVNMTSHGVGSIVETMFLSDNSAVFWFFSADSWEVMVKMPPGTCGFGAFWVFSAATTNVHYRIDAADLKTGAVKTYFNYAGPPAPAVTDTAAFATCP